MEGKSKIALDYSHNNTIKLEGTSYVEFTQFLFNSGYKIGKIQTGFDSLDKIEAYDTIIISSPKNVGLNPTEIEVLVEYVKKGGNLLLLSSSGGDFSNKTNLNELARNFGFEFEYDEVNDSMSYINFQKRPLLTEFKPHVISEHLKKVVFSSACSLKILDFIADEENIKIDDILRGGLNFWHKKHDGKEWIEEDCPRKPLVAAVEYYKGKVVGFGCLSIFSSLGREYGFLAFENNVLIANILGWLTTSIHSTGKILSVNLDLDLFYWADSIIKKDDWSNMSDLINVGMKHFKDNYQEIIKTFQEIREEKIKRRKEFEATPSESFVFTGDLKEDKVLDLIPARDTSDLKDIMSALQDVTGETYELSINLDEEEEESKENDVPADGEVKEIGDTVNEIDEEEKIILEHSDIETSEFIEPFTMNDLEEFEKTTSMKAIRQGRQTLVFQEWLKRKN